MNAPATPVKLPPRLLRWSVDVFAVIGGAFTLHYLYHLLRHVH